MTCDSCTAKEATVFLHQSVNGQVHKVNLCEECAQEKGVTNPTGFALTDLFEGIGSEQKSETPQNSMDEVCQTCGFTQTDFKKTGRLGCSDCFEIFGAGLEGLLKAMHKGTRHVGKVPARASEEKAREDQLSDLKVALESAVTEERYEDAASIRDQIQQLAKTAE